MSREDRSQSARLEHEKQMQQAIANIPKLSDEQLEAMCLRAAEELDYTTWLSGVGQKFVSACRSEQIRRGQ